MTKTRSVSTAAAVAGVALALLAGAGSAQARDVNWSVGIGVPGVVVGASNGYYAPATTPGTPMPTDQFTSRAWAAPVPASNASATPAEAAMA